MTQVTRPNYNLLPSIFRTDTNKNFLNATVDQITQPNIPSKLFGFVGERGDIYKITDQYLTSTTALRQNYQLVPGTVIRNHTFEPQRAVTFDDLLNQLQFYGVDVSNQNKLFEQTFYSWAPPVDYDKLVNYGEYYWSGEGPLLVDITEPVDITSNVLGQATATIGNVKFTNGLKLRFTNQACLPSSYINNIYLVEGVGTNIRLVPYVELVTPESYNQTGVGVYDSNPYDTTAYDVDLNNPTVLDYITINRGSKDRNAWSRNNRWFHKNVLEYAAEFNNVDTTLDSTFKARRPIIEFESDIKLWDHGTTYKTPLDLINFDETDVFSSIVGQPSDVVKIDDVFLIANMRVIFAGDTDNTFVTNKTLRVEINETEPEDLGSVLGSVTLDLADGGYQTITTAGSITLDFTGWAPIGKARAVVLKINLDDSLHTISVQPNVVLPSGFTFPTATGTYTYQFLSEDNGTTIKLSEKTSKVYTISLVNELDFEPNEIDHLLVKYGTKYGKSVFRYDGSTWVKSRQQKTDVQQPPLFDLYNTNSIPLNDNITYPGNTFTGNKLFGYATGTGSIDPVLNFPIKYKTYNGIGDIVFQNYIQTETYAYLNNQITSDIKSNICFYNQNGSLENDYVRAAENSKQFIIYSAIVSVSGGYILTLPIEKYTDSLLRTTYVYRNNVLLVEGSDYTISNQDIIFNKELEKDEYIEIRMWNPAASSTLDSILTRFETPINALAEPSDEPLENVTLGQMRQQVASAVKNVDIEGTYPGESNLRDLQVKNFSNLLIRNSAGLKLVNFFLTDEQANLINSIRFGKSEYSKFKQKFIHAATQVEYVPNVQSMFDKVMYSLIANKDNTFPFAFSDMFAFGDADASNSYTILDVDYKDFSLNKACNSTKSNGHAVLVFLKRNNVTTLLKKNYDYTFLTDSVIRANIAFNLNDQIIINEYYQTDGSYCPPTPTKLGLWPAYKPEMYLDDTLINPINVIQGHDGSITPAFGDFRDNLLLELETRIFNNIKVYYDRTLFDYDDIIPGRYRINYFSQDEFNNIISKEFLNWASRNSVKYTKNNYDYNISFTWNFSDTTDTETGEQLPGFWRTIYRYYYDTDRPHTHPWEMLGFSQRPDWWIAEYGDAPYTSDNLVLWQDLEAGYIRAGENAGTTLSNKARPELSNRIPVDHQGILLPPNEVGISDLTLNYDVTRSWSISDIGPVQSAWMRSSEYPYAMQIAAALCKPSSYVYKMFDRDVLTSNAAGQIVYTETLLPFTHTNLKLQGVEADNTVYRGSGYQNFISDWFRQQNYDRITYFYNPLTYMTSNLLYKLAGYSDNTRLQFYLEKNTPGSLSSNTQIPSENIVFLNNKSTPITTIDYSGMVIERTENGYSITGYDYVNGYFNILPVIENENYAIVKLGQISETFTEFLRDKSWQPPQIFKYNSKFYRVIKAFSGDFDPSSVFELVELPSKGGVTVVQYKSHRVDPVKISYGTEFKTVQEVYDFINGYQAYLESIGVIFNNTIPGTSYEANYLNSAKEFLFWTLQQWVPGSVIKLSPGAYKLRMSVPRGIAIDQSKLTNSFFVVDQNGLPIRATDLAINRFEGQTEIQINSNNTELYGLKLCVIEYEHVVIFDNNTLFNDLIYDPINGYKQKRIKASGYKTGGWDGSFGGSGFIVDTGIVDDWAQYKDYRYGDTVKYLNNYYFSNNNHVGTEVFDFNNWDLVTNKPSSRILTNLDTKASDLEKVYDMISVLGNEDMRVSAAHQIGYNKKNYLDPIASEELSQIKFYQGFIKEKGTKNSINAVRRAEGVETSGEINVFEEWAIRVGEYGTVDNTQILKVVLEEDKFKNNPQIISFKADAESTSPQNTIFMKPSDKRIIEKPKGFMGDVWKKVEPGIRLDNDLLTSGHVRLDEIDETVVNIEQVGILNFAYDRLTSGFTIYCAFDYQNDWNVYRLGISSAKVLSLSVQKGTNKVEIEFDRAHGIEKDEWFLIKNSFNQYTNGFHKAFAVEKPTCLVFEVDGNFNNVPPISELLLFKLESLKFTTIEDLLAFQPIDRWNDGEYAWVLDNGNETWATYTRTSPYDDSVKLITNNQIAGDRFGTGVVATDDDYYLIVAGNERANIFKRDTYNPNLGTTTDLKIFSTLAINVPTLVTSNTFGSVMAIGSDNNLVLLSDPNADKPGVVSQGYVYSLIKDLSGNWGQDISIESPSPLANGNFGSSLSLSKKVKYSDHITIIGDNTSVYSLDTDSSINFTKATDVKVFFNNTLLTETVDYNFTRTITLTTILTLTDYITIGTITPYVISGNGTNSYTIPADVFADSIIDDVTKIKITKNVSTVPLIYTTDYMINNVELNLVGGPATSIDILEIITNPVYAFIGEAGTNNTYVYINRTIGDSLVYQQTLTNSGLTDNYGISSAVSDNAGKLVIGSSYHTSNTGKAYLYEKTGSDKYNQSYSLVASTTGENINDFYGNAVEISPDGNTVYVAAYRASPNQNGRVYVYNFSDQTLIQTIEEPEQALGVQFGYSLSLNPTGTKLVVGSIQSGNRNLVPFDSGTTVFDNDGTIISDYEGQSGKAWVYNKYNDYFYYEQGLSNFKVKHLDEFSKNLYYTNHAIYIGASNDDTYGDNAGLVYEYDNQNNNSCWEVVHIEPSRVAPQFEDKKFIYNSRTNSITNYIDSFDPAKGKIIGIAEDELFYKTSYDPAFYDVGFNNVRVDSSRSWDDEQVGRLWWDLSSIRYLNYEQGDLNFRKTNWGKLFPGCSVDVYEWVKSEYLPSQWATISLSTSGATQGITGIPKNANDTIYSVRTEYNSLDTTQSKTVYYYWVKNTTTVPQSIISSINDINVKSYSRQLSAAEVTSIITDPNSQGYEYLAYLDSDTIACYNINNTLTSNDKILTIQFDILPTNNLIHTEWLLFKANSEDRIKDPRFDKKLIDSLVGQDSFGNIIPDPLLNENQKYGTLVIPRQSFFKDRREAMKLLIDRTNAILQTRQIVYERDLKSLYLQEEFPTATSGVYDIVVDSYEDLEYVDVPANTNVLVKSDSTSLNKWSIFNYSGTKWIKKRIQSFNIPLSNIWELTDWYETGYDENTIITNIVDDADDVLAKYDANVIVTNQVSIEADLARQTFQDGAIIKVNNVNGVWRLYYNDNGTLIKVGEQNATIKFTDKIFSQKYYGFDNLNYDAGPYDDEPFIEIRYVLECIKNDILIGDLSKYWNDILVALLRFIHSEQGYIDWLFKSSFITVDQNLRTLVESVNYVKDNNEGFLNFMNELKPYHTKIRSHNIIYDRIESVGLYATDFDLPPYYDSAQDKYVIPSYNNDLLLLDGENWIYNFPYNFWTESYRMYLSDVRIFDGGTNYSSATVKIIPNDVDVVTVIYNATNSSGSTLKVSSTTGVYPGMMLFTSSDFDSPSGITVSDIVDDTTLTLNVAPLNLMNNQTLRFSFVSNATVEAIIYGTSISSIIIIKSGSGYTNTPSVEIFGDGTGAMAYASLDNDQIRSINTTIKFDRIKGSNDIQNHTINYSVGSNTIDGKDYYNISGITQNNPTLILERGNRYVISNAVSGDTMVLSRSSNHFNIDQYNDDITGVYPCTTGNSFIFSPSPNTPDILYYASYSDPVPATNKKFGTILVVDPVLYRNRYKGDGTERTFYLSEGKSFRETGYVVVNGSVIDVTSYSIISKEVPVINESINIVKNSFTLNVSDSQNLRKGQIVAGRGIRAGSYITSISGNTITLNKPIKYTINSIVQIFGEDKIMFNSAPANGDIVDIFSDTSNVYNREYHAADRILAYYKPLDTMLPKQYAKLMKGVEYPETVVRGLEFEIDLPEDEIDENLKGPIFTSYWGLDPSDILSNGSKFIDASNSYAPEENVPAQIFDTLDLRVWTTPVDPELTVGVRIFKNMANVYSYTRLGKTTYLTQELLLTDTEIYLNDVSILSDPNPELAIPGIIYVNAERIEYYEIDRINKKLTKFRRGCQGTGISENHIVGSQVEDGSLDQKLLAITFTQNIWDPGISIINSNTETAIFLRLNPADLPA